MAFTNVIRLKDWYFTETDDSIALRNLTEYSDEVPLYGKCYILFRKYDYPFRDWRDRDEWKHSIPDNIMFAFKSHCLSKRLKWK